jgi:cytochrome c556
VKIASVALFLTAGFGLLAFAQDGQDEAEFFKLMKTTGKENNALRKLDPKTGQEAAASAERIASAFNQMHGFWTKRNVTDAAKWTEEGKAAADELLAAARAGNTDKATTAYANLASTCKPCHEAHREKLPDGSYRIK